jgi:NAD+ diphosphatase
MRPLVHCPWCGTRLPALAGTGQTCVACGETSWQNAKPCASALVVRNGRVLLGRRAREPRRNTWDLPGGFLEPDETPEQAVRRELREETGLEIGVGPYLGSFVDEYGADTTLTIVFRCSVEGGEERPDDDVEELRWFPLDQLPPGEELSFRNVAAALARFAAERRGAGP